MSGSFAITYPDGFEGWEPIIEAKGWLADVLVAIEGARFRLTFYDPVRLGQEVDDDVRREGLFCERNLVIVPAVTRGHIEAAIGKLGEKGLRAYFVAESPE